MRFAAALGKFERCERFAQAVTRGAKTDAFDRLWLRLEQVWVRDVARGDVNARDHDAHAELAHVPEPRDEFGGQANAAMRGGTARKVALVHSNARPGQSVHVVHRCVVVEIGPVPAVLLDYAEDASRRRIAGGTGGYR